MKSFKLIKLNENMYSLIGSEINFQGNLIETISKMKSIMKYLNETDKNTEIEEGMKAVENDDFSEYGIFGRFIFSANFNRKVG